MSGSAIKTGDVPKMLAGNEANPAFHAPEGDNDMQQVVHSLFGKETVGRILRCARIIAEDTGYGQINLILTPKGVEYVTHQVWWKAPKTTEGE